MSWFGGGKKEPQSEKSFATDDSFGSSGGSMPISGGGGGAGMSDFQEFSVGLQQQLLVQQAITDMAERAFTKCISSAKDSQLSGKEVACISAVTNKWLDTNEFMAGRLQRKQQQQQQQSFG